MTREEIKGIIPHRDNMLLVDEAVVSEDGVAKGKYTVKGDEWFLQGHFPGNPVVPGVILCEILAQSTCVLLSGKCTGDSLPFFTGLDKVKFRNPVVPGDIFETECEIKGNKGPFYFASGKGTVNGKICVTCEFSFAIVKK